MANENKNIEQVFKKGFENFEHDVSSKVWQNLDSELFQNEVADYSTSVMKSFLLSMIPLSVMIGASFLANEDVSEENNSHSAELVINTPKQEKKSVENITEEVVEEMSVEDLPQNNEEILLEDDKGEFVEKLVVSDDTEVAKEEKEVYKPKEMPKLSDKEYLNYSYFKNRGSESYSNYSITKLRKGALLVRLKTRESSISALLKSGQKKKAEKLKQEVFEDNKEVVDAFKKFYSFSDVLFFYSSESDNVREGDFKNIFLDEKTLKVDASKSFDQTQKYYMILDIGPLKIPTDEGEFEETALSRALVVKDKEFEQMYRPFPFYVNAASKSNIEKQVMKLNGKFHHYHEQNVGKY